MEAVEPNLAALNKRSVKALALCSNRRANAFTGVIRGPWEFCVYRRFKGSCHCFSGEGLCGGWLEPFDRSRRIWTGGKKMVQDLKVSWSRCYFVGYRAGAACVGSPQARGGLLRNAPLWVPPPPGSPSPKPQNPNECVFLLNGQSLKYETQIFSLRRVELLTAFLLLVFIFQMQQWGYTNLLRPCFHLSMANQKPDARVLIVFILILVCLLRTFSLFFSTMEVCLPLGIQIHFVTGEELPKA